MAFSFLDTKEKLLERQKKEEARRVFFVSQRSKSDNTLVYHIFYTDTMKSLCSTYITKGSGDVMSKKEARVHSAEIQNKGKMNICGNCVRTMYKNKKT